MLAAIHDQLLDCAPQLRSGDIGVLKTDTIYGLVADANNQEAVERIYQVKGRSPDKPPIVLIGSINQLFDDYPDSVYDYLNDSWPGPRSIILPSTKAPSWLTRDSQSIAYRLPDNQDLRQLLIKTGPIIAPSANPEGQAPAASIIEAIGYFSDTVDFYVDSGQVDKQTPPSELWRYDVDSNQSDQLR